MKLYRQKTFLQHLGRTNTEYGSWEPKYGSSVPISYANRSQKVLLSICAASVTLNIILLGLRFRTF